MGDKDLRKKVQFYVYIYIKILVQDIKSKLSYRADFVISTLGMILTNVTGYISFWILFNTFSEINGWNYYEMLFFYGFSLMAITPSQCFFDNNWNLQNSLVSGDFIKYCVRPLNIFFYYISEVFDIKGLGQFVFGIVTVWYSWHKLNITFSVLRSV